MPSMAALGGIARLGLSLSLLSAVLSFSSCSRSSAANAIDSKVQQGSDAAPFRQISANRADVAPTRGALTPGAQGREVPFGVRGSGPKTLAAGTLLAVRFQTAIPSANLRAGDSFSAKLAEPVNVDGGILIERGAIVSGSVVSVRGVKDSGDRGYARLVLVSIRSAGRDLPIQTSSLFVREAAPGMLDLSPSSRPGGMTSASSRQSSVASTDAISVSTGRRLTFRLTEPLFLGQP